MDHLTSIHYLLLLLQKRCKMEGPMHCLLFKEINSVESLNMRNGNKNSMKKNKTIKTKRNKNKGKSKSKCRKKFQITEGY